MQMPNRTGPDRRRRLLGGLAAATMATAVLSPAAAQAAHADPFWGPPWPTPPVGHLAGARLPGLYEELATGPQASTDGSVIGPSYTQGTLASEAVSRQAVQLSAPGQYLTFRLARPANAVDISYSLPQGTVGALQVSVDGQPLPQSLALTSAYDYISTPGIYGSKVHHFFDDARTMFGRRLPAGATVTFSVPPGATGLPCTVDLADFYDVAPPRRQPPGSLPVTDFGADPSGATDSTAAFASAISQAAVEHRSVWLPPGRYLVSHPLQVDAADIVGAGSWYTEVLSNELIDNTAPVPGPVDLSGFAIMGSTVGRHDDGTANAIDGSLGTGSVVQGLWVQDTNVGFWLQYGNNHVTVRDNVVLDTDADGLNLNGNATDCVVADNLVRNTGDDGLAIWSYPADDAGNVLVANTVEQPNLANGIADYGGTDNSVLDNLVMDTNALGSGITVSNEQFASPGFTPLSGRILVAGNTVVRAGAMNPNWGHPMSAVQIDSYDYPITGARVVIADDAVLDSPYSAFELVSGGGQGLPIDGLSLRNVLVDGVGTVVFQAETAGSATVSGLRAYHVGVPGTVQDQYPPGTAQFQFETGPGNQGWSLSPVLAYFPAPVPSVP